MADLYYDGPFVTGQCLRCGMEAVGGICGECLAELADFIDGADLVGLSRWAAAWPGGRGANLTPAEILAGPLARTELVLSGAPAARPVSMRKARVQFRRDCEVEAPGLPGITHTFRRGEITTLWQMSAQPDAPLDTARDRWWSEIDLDYAYIVPAEAVEVIAVLEERPEGGEVSRGNA